MNKVGNVYWVCRKHRKKASDCDLASISEEEFKKDFGLLMEALDEDDTVVRDHLTAMEARFRSDNSFRLSYIESRTQAIDQEADSLQRARDRVRIAEYISRQNALAAERYLLQDELETMTDKRIEETEELLRLVHNPGGSFHFEDTFDRLVESVTVYDSGCYSFHFKCGLALEYDGR